MSDQVLSSDFLDMAAFYLAVTSVDEIILGVEADPETFPGVNLKDLQAHRATANAPLRRISASVDEGLDSLLRASMEKAKIRVKTRLDASLRGNAFSNYAIRADFLMFYLPRLRIHSEVLRDIFGTDASQATRIAAAGDITNPLFRLFKLAGIRMTSGKLSLLKRWTQAATELCGNPVSEIEEVAVDVTTTDVILDKVARNERRLDFLDPTDPAAAEAEQENVELLARVSRVADNSKDPASVKAHAAAKLAAGGEHGKYATRMSAYLKMTPEQEDAMLVRGRSVIAAGAGSGKCVTGDTLVSTAMGMRRIDECTGTMSLPSVDAEGLIASTEQATWLDMGTSPVIEIRTRSGVTLRGTPEHPLLTWDGKPSWVRLDAMQVGDSVLLQPGHAFGTGTAVMDPEESYLLGLLMGDGWVDVPGRRVGWSRGGDFLPQHFYSLAERFWGKTPNPTQKEGTNSITHWLHSVELVQRLEAQGVAFSSARDKSVPTAILSATDAERIRFLQGLFDTDGTATGDRVVEWLSASEILAKQVHQMLIGLGVVGMLRPKLVKGYDHTYWRVLIGGDQLRKFQENIGFRYEFKKSDDLAEICSNECNPNVGVYPHVQDLLTQVREDWKSSGRWNGRNQSLLMDDRWVQVKHYTQGARMPSRAKLLQLTSGCDSQAATLLKNLAGYYPDEIESVQLVPGEHRVYDFTVPTTHSFIANGIVSHNTRVLAGKVVHHLQDLGLKMSNVMAMSFTRDSADELQERIEDYAKDIGFPLPPSSNREAYAGIGTTHSIGLGIITANNKGRAPKLFPSYDLSNLMKVAIAQVKMLPSDGPPLAPPPEAMTFFPNPPSSTEDGDSALGTKSPIQNPVAEKAPIYDYFQDANQFKIIVSSAIDTINDFLSMIPKIKIAKTSKPGLYANVLEIYGPGLDRFGDLISRMKIDGRRLDYREADEKYRSPRRFVAFSATPFDQASAMNQLKLALGADRAENALQALQQFSGTDPSALSENERSIMVGILSNQSIQEGLAKRNIPVKKMASSDGVSKAIQNKLEKIGENKIYGTWLRNPANQWFNIGASDEDFEVEDPRSGEKKPIPPADFTRFVGFNKNSLKAPGTLFTDSQNSDAIGVGEDDEDSDMSKASQKVYAAVYGAYEWLKTATSEKVGGMIEFDDMLVLSTRALIENSELRAQYQKQYKCVLVDEAQDLNSAQHLFIGLVAGYLDPATLKPRTDGKMAADTFCFIGDDKQAIYGFRAAAPKQFTEKSDIFEGENEGFTTKLLDTNFRSGSAIVNAANQLIARNTDQIPMVCKTSPSNGEGYVQRVSVQDPEDAADRMTDQILEDLENVNETGKPGKFYSNYGLAVRTNRELYEYAMKMIEKGIPFRSKKNFLGGPVGGIIGLFAVTQTADVKARNAGVLTGTKTPDFGMSPDTLEEKLTQLGVTDYYDFLVNQNGAERVWPRFPKMSRPLQAYADYLKELFALKDEPAVDIINFITGKKNFEGVTLVDTLSAAILDDKEAMDEIQLEADKTDGRITQDMLADYALGPIQPLIKATTRFPGATEFAAYVGSLLKSNQPNVPKRSRKGEPGAPPVAPSERPDAVQLGTIHGWKGLEVRNLYVPMWDGGFPHHRSQGSEKLIQEERRLAYVALTRGQQKVTVLEPKTVNGKDVEPSQFMDEACIPLNGTDQAVHPDAFSKTSSFAEYLKTASVEDFLIPAMSNSKETEQKTGSAGDWLIAQWGRLAHQGGN